MAGKTNCIKNGVAYYRIRRKVGKKLNKNGVWVDDYKEFYGKNKKDAERKCAEYKEKRAAGIMTQKQFFGILADHFIKNVFLPDSRYTARTKEKYVSTWNRLVRPSSLAGRPLDLVHSADLQAFYNELDCTPGAIKTVSNMMKLFYKYLEQEGYCRNIASGLKIPEKRTKKEQSADSKEIIVWTDEEVKAILDNSGEYALRFLIVLAINTGLRISELLALRYDDFDGDVLHVRRQVLYAASYDEAGNLGKHEFVLQEPKYNSVRDVPLNAFVLEELREHTLWHKEEMLSNGYRTEYLFTTEHGNFLERRNVARSLERLYARIGIEKKDIHTYRRTFASKLCSLGVPIQTASVLLGHSSINVTAKYYVNIAHNERLAAVERLSEAYKS